MILWGSKAARPGMVLALFWIDFGRLKPRLWPNFENYENYDFYKFYTKMGPLGPRAHTSSVNKNATGPKTPFLKAQGLGHPALRAEC